MPIWLRKFTFNQIYEARNAEAEANKKSAHGKGTNFDLNSSVKAKIPKEALQPKTTSPNYITGASTK
tara:strand:- start:288 stop:488 length:201 start_codon:yes stop_codon:yes gene_type:complete